MENLEPLSEETKEALRLWGLGAIVGLSVGLVIGLHYGDKRGLRKGEVIGLLSAYEQFLS